MIKELEKVQDLITKLQWENSILREENNNLKSEHYKDSELRSLQEKYDQLKKESINGFPITDEELKKIKEWQTTHKCKYRNTRLCGIDEYIFGIIPGIGYNSYVKCNCGEKFCFYQE